MMSPGQGRRYVSSTQRRFAITIDNRRERLTTQGLEAHLDALVARGKLV